MAHRPAGAGARYSDIQQRSPVKRSATITALVLGCALVLPGYTGSIEEAAEEKSSGTPVAASGVSALEAVGIHLRLPPSNMHANHVPE